MNSPAAMPGFEREVMEIIWASGPTTARAVLDEVNERGTRSPRAHTTVLTIMQRLEAKGLLERSRSRRGDVYVPRIGRTAYLRARADAEVDELIAEHGELALVQFARHTAALNDEQRARLRRLAGL